ncbi:MAG: toprim domain-containing protein [Candidatus Jorgensenbacteria bacterium]|nr:toprim domain-containing protein [Candidatus Jorgensenbacteria bacterium]
MIPEQIQKFIELFSKLPSIGPRLATRLAFYLVGKDTSTISRLEEALGGLKKLDRCERCFFLKNTDKKLCDICSDKKRDPGSIAIVEKETDLITIEKTGAFHGHYLVLGELAERGVFESAQKLRLQHLKARINKELSGKAKEIVIALSQNSFGDFTATLIEQVFKNSAEKITRIGRGVPTGGSIEFADEETIMSAFKRRN